MIAATAHLVVAPPPAPEPAPVPTVSDPAAAPTTTDTVISEDTPMTDGTAPPPDPIIPAPIETDTKPPSDPTGDAQSPTTDTAPAEPRPLDIRYEASKIPLDLAILHSIRASSNPPSGGQVQQSAAAAALAVERTKRLFQFVLVVGGTALTPGMLHALESRLKELVAPPEGAAAAAVPAEEAAVGVIPAPKEIDPRVLCWKGVAVLAKLETVGDLWVQQADWVSCLLSFALLVHWN